MSIADELEKLANLRDSGVLTEDEFRGQKAKILGKYKPPQIEKGDENNIEGKKASTGTVALDKSDTTAKTASKKDEIVSYITILFLAYLGYSYFYTGSSSLENILKNDKHGFLKLTGGISQNKRC
jgi:Short C-terminal domain